MQVKNWKKLVVSYVMVLFLLLLLSSSAQAKNVIQLGADPSGIKDSTAIIQSALDKGGVVDFPRGTYRISKTLHITQSKTSLTGEHGAVIYLAPGQVRTALRARTKDADIWKLKDIRIEGLIFRNDPSNYQSKFNAGIGIGLHGVKNATIKNCRIENFVHSSVHISICRNVTIRDTRIIGGRHGIDINGHYQSGRHGNWNILVDNCHVSDTWDTGVVIAYYSHHVTMSNSIVERSKCHGVDIFHAYDVVIKGNVIKNWLDRRIAQGGNSEQSVGVFVHTDLLPSLPTENITILGNIIERETAHSGKRPYCIQVWGNVNHVMIAGNIIDGGISALAVVAWRNDPAIPPPHDIVFSKNICRNQVGPWLYIVDKKQKMSVELSNNIFCSKGPVVLSANNSSIIFRGNWFRGSGFSSIVKKSTVLDGNLFSAEVGKNRNLRRTIGK